MPDEQVDIVISYDLNGKIPVTIDTLEGQVKILGLKDLIEMKRASGRPQDNEDIKALERLS